MMTEQQLIDFVKGVWYEHVRKTKEELNN
jgi:hypothetical protein